MLDTGCAVEYKVGFLDNNNVIIGNKTSNSTFICDTDYGNAASVIMWATFNGFRGKDSEVKSLQTSATTTTTSTSTIVTSTSKGNTPFKVVEIYEIK